MEMTLKHLQSLVDGWNGPGSKAVTAEAIETAANMRPVPANEGGIQLELHAGGVDIEIRIDPDGTVKSVYFERVT